MRWGQLGFSNIKVKVARKFAEKIHFSKFSAAKISAKKDLKPRTE